MRARNPHDGQHRARSGIVNVVYYYTFRAQCGGQHAFQCAKNKMRPNPCLPSDTIVVYMSPFIAGTPPASSSGRGRGSTSASLFSSRWAACGVRPFFVLFSSVARGIPPADPPPAGRRDLSNPPESEGSGAVLFYFCACIICRKCLSLVAPRCVPAEFVVCSLFPLVVPRCLVL